MRQRRSPAPNRQPTFGLIGGNWSKCPLSDLRGRGNTRRFGLTRENPAERIKRTQPNRALEGFNCQARPVPTKRPKAASEPRKRGIRVEHRARPMALSAVARAASYDFYGTFYII
jgi:hypothetical protein